MLAASAIANQPVLEFVEDDIHITICVAGSNNNDGTVLIKTIGNILDFFLNAGFAIMWVYKLHKLKNVNKGFDHMSRHSRNGYRATVVHKFRSHEHSDSRTQTHTQPSDEQKEKVISNGDIIKILPGKSNQTHNSTARVPIPKIELSNIATDNNTPPPITTTPIDKGSGSPVPIAKKPSMSSTAFRSIAGLTIPPI